MASSSETLLLELELGLELLWRQRGFVELLCSVWSSRFDAPFALPMGVLFLCLEFAEPGCAESRCGEEASDESDGLLEEAAEAGLAGTATAPFASSLSLECCIGAASGTERG